MKKLLVLFRHVTEVHLKKDVGLFSIYLSKFFDETVLLSIYNEKQEQLPEQIKKVRIKTLFRINKYPYGRIKQFIQNCWYGKRIIQSVCDDKTVTHIMLFHWNFFHLYVVNEIKKLRPDIKIYLKLDCSIDNAKNIVSQSLGNQKRVLKSFIESGIKNIDLITSETLQTAEILKTSKHLESKTFYAPNGYDDSLLKTTNQNLKEKSIITVGRLGTSQKNSELLLRIIKELQLKDWKVKLIGPIEKIEKNFQKDIDLFYSERPDLKNTVIFTGPINNSEKLVEEYQKASIFILTSRFESSGLVLLEAAINGCFVCTTDVGVGRDLCTENNFCFIVPESQTGEQNEEKIKDYFVEKLQACIDNTELCYEKFDKRIAFYKSNFMMSEIVAKDFFQKFWISK
jgi:glycosyltransferase involved in cell wall biosynthesis